MPGRRSTQFTAFLLLGATCWTVAGREANGQNIFRGRRRTQTLRPAIIERPAELQNLLRRAEEGIDRGDWKLVIDSLQRVLDSPEGGLMPVTMDDVRGGLARRYRLSQSVSRIALDMLASLPDEGIEAYRILYDGKARTMLAEARAEVNAALLGELVDRFLLTSSGDEAAELLAGWWLDLSNPTGALHLINQIERYCTDSDVPRWRLAIKKAIALNQLGDRSSALDQLAQVSVPRSLEPSHHERISQTRQWIEASSLATMADTMVQRERWPQIGGSVGRRNLMPPISPELREGLPWRTLLPMTEPDWWEVYLASAEGDFQPPAAQPVIGEGRIFIKSGKQLGAYDLEGLDPLWVSARPTGNGSAQSQPRDMRGERFRLLEDHILAAVSIAFGQVYCIEREGRSDVVLNDESGGALDRDQIDRSNWSALSGTRLVARDVTSGDILWQRGRSGLKQDALGSVHFLATPIPVEDKLWVPYARNGDVFLAVLDPEDGRLVRRKLLCTTDVSEHADRYANALLPAADAQNVYLVTQFGLVIAVGTQRFTPRWAMSYPRSVGRRSDGGQRERNWLCGPPIVTGSVLVVAPVDSDELFVLDRANGRIRWAIPRPSMADYVIACDQERIWLGGDALYCVSLLDGRMIWSTAGDGPLTPTGRAVLSGETLLVPVQDALLAFDASEGSQIERTKLPADQLALGNLLCIANGLLSVDTNELRKFPDMSKSYPRQLALYKEDPLNARAALRMAWMELLRDAPQRAYAILEKLRKGATGVSPVETQVNRLRVRTLLTLAESPEAAPADSIAHLREAVELADRDQDRLTAMVALAFRLRDAGRLEEAYLRLWRLGLTSACDVRLTVEDKLRRKARHVVAEALRALGRDLSAGEARSIRAQTTEEVDHWIAALGDANARSDALQRLGVLAELDDVGGAAQTALVTLARDLRQRELFERSAYRYRQAIRSNRVRTLTGQALFELADLYASPQQRLYLQADRLLARLAREFSDLAFVLPGSEASDAVSASVASAHVRSQLDAEVSNQNERTLSPQHIVLVDEGAGMVDFTEPGRPTLLTYNGERTEATCRRVLVHAPPDRLRCYDAISGQMQWESRLALLARSADDLTAGQDADVRVDTRVHTDGQVAVLNGPEGIYGIGMITGRRLWGTPYEDVASRKAFALRNRLVAVEDGIVVYAPRRGVLTAAAVIDSQDVLWERLLTGEKLDTVFVEDGLCITLDAPRRRARIYALQSGHLISELEFEQPGVEAEPVPLVYVDGFLVGPSGPDAISAYNVRSGEVAWSRQVGDEIVQIFKPGEGFVGVSTFSGRVELIDSYDGTVATRVQMPLFERGDVDGVLKGELLVLMPVQRQPGGADPALVALNVETGRLVWQREPFGVTGADRFAVWRLLRTAEEVVPMFARKRVLEGNRFERQKGEIALEVVDKDTGRTVGPVVRTGQAVNLSERLTGVFGVWEDTMLIDTEEGILSADVRISRNDLRESNDDS